MAGGPRAGARCKASLLGSAAAAGAIHRACGEPAAPDAVEPNWCARARRCTRSLLAQGRGAEPAQRCAGVNPANQAGMRGAGNCRGKTVTGGGSRRQRLCGGCRLRGCGRRCTGTCDRGARASRMPQCLAWRPSVHTRRGVPPRSRQWANGAASTMRRAVDRRRNAAARVRARRLWQRGSRVPEAQAWCLPAPLCARAAVLWLWRLLSLPISRKPSRSSSAAAGAVSTSASRTRAT